MNYYQAGLVVDTSWDHEVLDEQRARVLEISEGVQLIRSNAPRMYEVGASEKQTGFAPTVSGVVGWLSDIGTSLVLIAGIFIVAGALRGESE